MNESNSPAKRNTHMPNTSTLTSVLPFQRVAVLGAGTMGAQIAAHLANTGLQVELLDIPAKEGPRNAIVDGAFRRMTKMKPSPLYASHVVKRIRTGNFDDHLDRLSDVDWVIEAIIERADSKQSLFERVEGIIKDEAIVSSNTSGIPISTLVEGRSSSFQQRFLGTHFFNPPRYLKLFEVIPGEKTAPEVIERVSEFARVHLGKGVVLAKDSPYFIGNRIGIFAMLLAMRERSEHGFSIEEVDALTGELVGHPRSATFRTADVVGLDVMVAVISTLGSSVTNDESADLLVVPPELASLVERGHLGSKSGAGYYRKEGRNIRSWDSASGTYADAAPLQLDGLQEMSKAGDLAARMRALFAAEGKIGESFRRTTLGLLSYAACRIPDITDQPSSVDDAIRFGFGWEAGPFQIWDAIGFDSVRSAIREAGLALPTWVKTMSADASFYGDAGSSCWNPETGTLAPLTRPADEQLFASAGDVLFESDHSCLRRLTEDVALFEFRTKANTLGSGLVADLMKAVEVVESTTDLRGMVIANGGTNFSVGANLMEMGQALLAGRFNDIATAVATFQQAMERVRNSLKPVVVAVHSRVLGGATELTMSCRTPVAVAESYLGLVELGVGLIPAGTGCLRLMEQAATQAPNGHPSEILPSLQRTFGQVAMAEVATSAVDAIGKGYLAASAPIVMREERRFAVAVAQVRALSESGYLPVADDPTVHVLGAPGRAAFESMAWQFHQGQFISDHDLLLARKLAYVMTGGDLPGDAHIPRQHILDLERETFLSLLGEEKTQLRIRHLLETGKPLRN